MLEHLIDGGFVYVLHATPLLHVLLAALIIVKAAHFYSRFHVWYYEVWIYFPKYVMKSVASEDGHLQAMKFQNALTNTIILLFTADVLLCILKKVVIDAV
jgi:hypothetical protein